MEEWKQIDGFPSYLISSSGRVKNIVTNKMISTPIHKHGYRCVRLWNNGHTRLLKIYRLIALHFIPNPENKREVNHLNGNRMDHSINNLEWTTPSENMRHAVSTGLAKGQFKRGQNTKLSEDDVKLLRRWKQSGFYEYKKMNKVFNVCNDHANRVANGKEAYCV